MFKEVCSRCKNKLPQNKLINLEEYENKGERLSGCVCSNCFQIISQIVPLKKCTTPIPRRITPKQQTTLICLWTITILIALGCLVSSGCSSTKVYVLGIDANQAISDMKSEDAGKIILGAVASVATHIAGHYIAAEMVGGDIDQQGIREVVINSGELSESDHRWIARGGFVAQTLVNMALTSFEATRKSYFTRGFTLATMLEIGTYPLRWQDEGDLHYLEEYGGNSEIEWGLYTGASLYNFYAINKDRKEGKK